MSIRRFWSNIFGKGKESTKGLTKEELYAKIESLLQEVENKLTQGDLKSAMKLLGNIPLETTSMIAMNGPFHEQFANLVLKCSYQKGLNSGKTTPPLQYKDLPSLTVIVAGREANILGEAIDFVETVDKELVCIVDLEEMEMYGLDSMMKSCGVDPRSKNIDDFILGAGYDIETLYEFAVDPHAISISIQPWSMFIRRSFLVSKASGLRLDIKIKELWEELRRQKDIYEDDGETALGYPFFKYCRKI